MEEVGGTPEGTRENGFTGIQRNINQKEFQGNMTTVQTYRIKFE